MSIKLLGAFLIISGCGSFGFLLCKSCRQEENALRQVILALEYIKHELSYRLTPLPELCRQACNVTGSPISDFFSNLATALESQLSPDAAQCVRFVLNSHPGIPPMTEKVLLSLGWSLGKFDVNGQVCSLDAVTEECKRYLTQLTAGQQTRLRTYKTLGLCAGAALAILFI